MKIRCYCGSVGEPGEMHYAGGDPENGPRHPHVRVPLGARVRFSAEWLRNTGQLTGEIPFARGHVSARLGVEPERVVVLWDEPLGVEDFWHVLAVNLEIVPD